MFKSLAILDINSHYRFKKLQSTNKFLYSCIFFFFSQRIGRKGDEVREFYMITLPVSLVTSVLESNGEFALIAISNCAESLSD